MISRREKLKKSMVKQREQILEKQLRLVTDDANVQQMSFMELSAIFEANHGPGIYDRTFAHVDAEVHNDNDFEVILSRYVPKKKSLHAEAFFYNFFTYFRLSGEVSENSATIRKDNPYRKNATVPTSDPTGKVAYKRIFSDTSASESDELLSPTSTSSNIRKSGHQKDNKSTFMTTAEAAARNAAAIRKKPVKGAASGRGGSQKNKAQPKKTVLTRSSRYLILTSDRKVSQC